MMNEKGKCEKHIKGINCSVKQVAVSPFGKALCTVLKGGAKIVALTAENPDMITESIKDMPLRSFSGFTGGILSQESVDGILDLCNGKKGGFKLDPKAIVIAAAALGRGGGCFRGLFRGFGGCLSGLCGLLRGFFQGRKAYRYRTYPLQRHRYRAVYGCADHPAQSRCMA